MRKRKAPGRSGLQTRHGAATMLAPEAGRHRKPGREKGTALPKGSRDASTVPWGDSLGRGLGLLGHAADLATSGRERGSSAATAAQAGMEKKDGRGAPRAHGSASQSTVIARKR